MGFAASLHLYLVGFFLDGCFGFASELRQRRDRFVSATLGEKKVRWFWHYYEAEEEKHRQDGTDDPEDRVTDERPDGIGIQQAERDEELKERAQRSSDGDLQKSQIHRQS